MRALRNFVDDWYVRNRDDIFSRTEDNPKLAHKRFVRLARRIEWLGLSRMVLDCPENTLDPGFEISNAAGFNKDGLIPPLFLKYLGLDRIVVGTVTGDPWDGNSGQTIWRYPDTWSMVNCEGLPGVGAEAVAENLHSFGNHGVPITLSVMAAPGVVGDRCLYDLEKTVRATRNIPFLNTYQLNDSCPNTHGSSGGLDARRENQKYINEMLWVLEELALPRQSIELKASPDLSAQDVEGYIEVISRHPRVVGISTTNTTTIHDPMHIPDSPGKGGASGDAVYELARNVQRMFVEKFDEIKSKHYVKACGGIRSAERALERISEGNGRVRGIEIYTPLIFRGPGLVRELRRIGSLQKE